jgi:hypothetical protein
MAERRNGWFGVIGMMAIGLVMLGMTGLEVLTTTSPATTYEAQVTSRDRREDRQVDSDGRRTTSITYEVVVRYAQGEVTIGAPEVYDRVRAGNHVLLEVSDRTGTAVGLRSGDFVWRRGSVFFLVLTGGLAALTFMAAGLMARALRRTRPAQAGPTLPTTTGSP